MNDPFATLRPRLFAIAYRMLGTRVDAEDVLQDAWLRWHRADREAVQSADGWLVTTVSRLAIDRLRTAQVERAAYVGWWLPEPIVELEAATATETADDVSVALLLMLERLTPDERAAFLLREVFEDDYAQIAALLDKSEPAVRQLVHRASLRVRQERPRFSVDHQAHRRVLEAFVAAAQSGERAGMRALLADDVRLVSDGGGKVPSFSRILEGGERIANLYWALARRLPGAVVYRIVTVNGEPGLLRDVEGQLESVQSLVIDAGQIVSIYAVRNPDKLRGLPRSVG